MPDQEARESVAPERVMVTTLREVVEGTLFHNERARLSDALNSEAQPHSRYIALKDASVFSIATGREILHSDFLMISHHHVIYLAPLSALQPPSHAIPVAGEHPAAMAGALPVLAAAAGSRGEAVPDLPDIVPAENRPAPQPGKAAPPDAKLFSRQAMLEVLTSIRANSPEPGGARHDAPRAGAR